MSLQDELRGLINLSHAYAWNGASLSATKTKRPDEPGLVSSLLDARIQSDLEVALRKELGATANVQVDSIFTHKTPQVTPAGKTPVEIGDLLLVRQHFLTRGMPASQGMALLLQAKKNVEPNSGDISSGKPNIQFELYRSWPSFTGHTRLAVTPDPVPATSGAIAATHHWDFKKTDPAGRFGEYVAVFGDSAYDFIPPASLGAATSAFAASLYPSGGSKTAWSSGPVYTTAAATKVACPNDFARTLELFFRGQAGEPFAPGVFSGPDHWSRFVNTMLGEAAKIDYTFLSSRTNVTADTARGARICTLMAMQPLLNLALGQGWGEQLVRNFNSDEMMRFWHPAYFSLLSSRRSLFLEDLRKIVRRVYVYGDITAAPPDGPVDAGVPTPEGGNHVPILSISTSGPNPLWHPRGARGD